MTLRHTIRLRGPRAAGARISGATLKTLATVLVDGCRRSLRLHVDGKSQARGPVPEWLDRAGDFDIVGLSEGSTVLEIEARPLLEAAPEVFQQGNFLFELDTGRTCLDLFEDGLARALAGDAESDQYDQGLLRHFSEFKKILARGFDSIELSDSNGHPKRRTEVTASRLSRVDELLRHTPPSQHVRVSGRLDTIRHSDRMFHLVLSTGERLKGIAEGVGTEDLADCWGQEVVLSGVAVFRPSGSVRQVEAGRSEERR